MNQNFIIRKKRKSAGLLYVILFFLLFISIFLENCQNSGDNNNLIVLEGQTMGTFYSIKIVKTAEEEKNQKYNQLQGGIDNLLEQINQQMSTYIENSEISKLNRFESTDWYPISYPLFYVIQNAIKLSEISGGAFDITIAPLVNLWGFGPEQRGDLFPTDSEIAERKKIIGFRNLELSTNPYKVRKKIPKLHCDLSAIAKGYGVDRVAEYLDSLRFDRYLVEIGGEIRTRGRSHTGEFWRIGISTADERGDIQKIIELNNLSVATSGDYRNYFEKDGIRYSHTIDPISGRPIDHTLASVTVIQPSCMLADGLATAIDVLGPVKGLDFALQQKLPVFLIVRTDTGFVEKLTPEFREILKQQLN
jgi:thiamine biosynthesis lipoprotein